ncbi:MAG: (2Fe-2S)-binding protein [Nitrospirae bacterium]|nr:(2Fe-2S)-binding protein [Nitrospirota bacterium]
MNVRLEIDGKEIVAEPGMTVLEAAGRYGIRIPTLCYHKALGPYGVCRLCIVEADGPGLDRMVTTSCNLKATEGMSVETASPRIVAFRKTILDLLLSATVFSHPLNELAKAAGIRRSSFGTEKTDKCILCGLCVRVCRDSIGADALRFETTGENRWRVAEKIRLLKERCIGCGACAAVCPVAAIRFEDTGPARNILVYGDVANTLDLVACSMCGTPYATQASIDSVMARIDCELRKGIKKLCPECSRIIYAGALAGGFPPDVSGPGR